MQVLSEITYHELLISLLLVEQLANMILILFDIIYTVLLSHMDAILLLATARICVLGPEFILEYVNIKAF